jgi:hypothetical protein
MRSSNRFQFLPRRPPLTRTSEIFAGGPGQTNPQHLIADYWMQR